MAVQGKYKKWLKKDNLDKLTGWARDGLNDAQIAKNIGIGTTSLYKWKNLYPEIAEALSKGKEVSDYQVENALFKSACGYFVEEEKEVQQRDENGEMVVVEKVKTKKYIVPSSAAQFFWLKNRRKDKWHDVFQAETKDTTVTIKMDSEAEEYSV